MSPELTEAEFQQQFERRGIMTLRIESSNFRRYRDKGDRTARNAGTTSAIPTMAHPFSASTMYREKLCLFAYLVLGTQRYE